MKNQRAREEQTVTIATGLGVFAGVLTVGIGSLAVVGAFSDMSEAFEAGLPWLIAISVLCGGAYVVRHRR